MREDPTARSILVAEDNGDLRAWLREVLENEGYAVLEAANGREVMEVLGRVSVDLCITGSAQESDRARISCGFLKGYEFYLRCGQALGLQQQIA